MSDFSRAGRALDSALLFFARVATALLVLLVVSILFEIVARYGFNRPTRWVSEFSEYALLYLAFLPAAWVLKREGHVKVEMLTDLLSERGRLYFHRGTSLVGALICGLFFVVSAIFTWENFQSGELLFRSVQVPRWMVLFAIPLGLLLLTLQFFRRIFTRPTGSSY